MTSIQKLKERFENETYSQIKDELADKCVEISIQFALDIIEKCGKIGRLKMRQKLNRELEKINITQ